MSIKGLKISLSMILLIWAIIACSSKSTNEEKKSDTLKVENKQMGQEKNSADSINKEPGKSSKGIEFTAKYICPDHCAGSGSDKQGVCPKCGMEYIENPDIKAIKIK